MDERSFVELGAAPGTSRAAIPVPRAAGGLFRVTATSSGPPVTGPGSGQAGEPPGAQENGGGASRSSSDLLREVLASQDDGPCEHVHKEVVRPTHFVCLPLWSVQTELRVTQLAGRGSGPKRGGPAAGAGQPQEIVIPASTSPSRRRFARVAEEWAATARAGGQGVRSMIQPPQGLHVTVCVLKLDNEVQEQLAADIISSNSEKYYSILSQDGRRKSFHVCQQIVGFPATSHLQNRRVSLRAALSAQDIISQKSKAFFCLLSTSPVVDDYQGQIEANDILSRMYHEIIKDLESVFPGTQDLNRTTYTNHISLFLRQNGLFQLKEVPEAARTIGPCELETKDLSLALARMGRDQSWPYYRPISEVSFDQLSRGEDSRLGKASDGNAEGNTKVN